MAERYVIFDFCGTVVDFQTANAFVNYVCSKKGIEKKGLDRFRIFIQKTRLGLLLSLIGIHASKWLTAWKIRGVSEAEINALAKSYYEEVVRPRFIKETLDLIKELRGGGETRFILLSAGYEQYLKYFAREFHFDYLIAGRLSSKRGVMDGRIKDDCLGRVKLKRLSKVIPIKTSEIVAAVSDDYSDLPILQLAKRKIVISQGRHQKWVTDDMEEIIYGETKGIRQAS